MASLGLHKGVAQVYGIKLKGLPAWFMHRTYHMSRIPQLNRKIRVVVDWTLALFLRREVVALGQLHHPREPFTEVTPAAERSAEARARDLPDPASRRPLPRAQQQLQAAAQRFGSFWSRAASTTQSASSTPGRRGPAARPLSVIGGDHAGLVHLGEQQRGRRG